MNLILLLSSIEASILFWWSVATGVVSLLLVFSLSVLAYTNKRVYKTYAIYLFLTLIYLMYQGFAFNITEEYWINSTKRLVQIFTFWAYIEFLSQFIELHEIKPKLDYNIKRVVKGLMGLGVLVYLVLLLSGRLMLFENYYFLIHLSLSTVIALFLLFKIWRVKGVVRRFFLMGNIVLFLSVIMSSTLTVFLGLGYENIYNYVAPVSIFYAGLSIEAAIFTIGLTFKLENESKEKLLAERRLVDLTENQNQILNTKISEKESELQDSFQMLREAEETRLKQEHEKEINAMELRLLRSQLNPHLIFNSLNTLKHFMIVEDKDMGLIYLKHLSQYMRKVLQLASATYVSLNEEIELSVLYIKMENIRHDGEVNCEVRNESFLDLDQVIVPPMILQPFVENAFHHGLLPKGGGHKELNIAIKSTEASVILSIRDNGIGRTESLNRKDPNNGNYKKSYGINMTETRLRQFYKNHQPSTTLVSINDPMDDHGSSLGTEVILRLPILKSQQI